MIPTPIVFLTTPAPQAQVEVDAVKIPLKTKTVKPLKTCLFCKTYIGRGSYRGLFDKKGDLGHRQIRSVLNWVSDIADFVETGPSASKYVCKQCLNKLDRLETIEQELEGRVCKLKEERDRLLSTLRCNVQDIPVPDAADVTNAAGVIVAAAAAELSGSSTREKSTSSFSQQQAKPQSQTSTLNPKIPRSTTTSQPIKQEKSIIEPVELKPVRNDYMKIQPAPLFQTPTLFSPSVIVLPLMQATSPVTSLPATPVTSLPATPVTSLPATPVTSLPVGLPMQAQTPYAGINIRKVETKSRGTQTGSSLDPPGTVKVMVTFPSGTVARRVKNPLHQRIVREIIARRASPQLLSKTLYKDQACRAALHRLVCYRLSCDGAELCSDKTPSMLRNTSTDDLMNINWDAIIGEWRQKSELLYQVLEAITTQLQLKQARQKLELNHFPPICVAGSILLNCRNQRVCRLQTAIGHILYHGGASEKTIVKMHKMGISVWPQTLQRIRQKMTGEHLQRMKNTVRTFLKDRKRMSFVVSEQRAYASSPSQSQEDNSTNGVSESPRSFSRPWDRTAFMDRVHSFSSLSWFAKPAWLSPLHCARYGWKNVETDLLQCVSCKAYFSGRLPAIFDSQVYEEQCQGMEEALRVAHDPCCPWMNNPSPESFLRLPPIKQSDARADYTANIRKLLGFGNRLPLFEASMLEELGLSEEMLQNLVNIGARDVAEENQVILHSACVLALCGWRADSWETGSEKVSCHCCKRTLGLWNHVPCDPEFTQDLESSGEDESESNIDALEVPMETENVVANGSETNGVQETKSPGVLPVVPSDDTAESVSESVRETVQNIMDRVSRDEEVGVGQSLTAFIKTEEGDVITSQSQSRTQTAEEGGEKEIWVEKEDNDTTGDQLQSVGDHITTSQSEGSSQLKENAGQSQDTTQVEGGTLHPGTSDDSQTTDSERKQDNVESDTKMAQNLAASGVIPEPEATCSTKELVTQILNQILDDIPGSQSVATETLEYADVVPCTEQSPSALKAPDHSETGTQDNQSEDSTQVQDTPISIRSSFEFPDFEIPTGDIDNPPRGQQEKTSTTNSHPLETPEISEMNSENPFSELSGSGTNLPMEVDSEANIFDIPKGPQANDGNIVKFEMDETDLSYSVQAVEANMLPQDRLTVVDQDRQNIADILSAVKEEPGIEPSDFTTFIESQISHEGTATLSSHPPVSIQGQASESPSNNSGYCEESVTKGEEVAAVQSPSSDHMTSETSHNRTYESSDVNREMTSGISEPCEAVELPTEPPRKKRRRKRFEPVPFHPLSEHRAWCHWSTVHRPTRLSVSPSQSEDSLQEPGWKYLLRILTTNMSPQESKIVNIVRTTPPHEGLKSIRKLFDRWTSPLVQSDHVS